MATLTPTSPTAAAGATAASPVRTKVRGPRAGAARLHDADDRRRSGDRAGDDHGRVRDDRHAVRPAARVLERADRVEHGQVAGVVRLDGARAAGLAPRRRDRRGGGSTCRCRSKSPWRCGCSGSRAISIRRAPGSRRRRSARPCSLSCSSPVRTGAATPALADDGILFRAGVRNLADVQAVTAEEHVVGSVAGGAAADPRAVRRHAGRIGRDRRRASASRRMGRGGFGVDGAVRDGRAWRLVLADGTRLPVSASYSAAVRARGWLRIKPKLGVA